MMCPCCHHTLSLVLTQSPDNATWDCGTCGCRYTRVLKELAPLTPPHTGACGPDLASPPDSPSWRVTLVFVFVALLSLAAFALGILSSR